MKKLRCLIAFVLLSCLSLTAAPLPDSIETFENIELIQPNGDNLRETDVRIELDDTTMRVIRISNRTVLKEWNYSDIKSAEYSYTKNPRWKTGLGLGAASILFPPLLLVAIPIGLTKHRRHWVTVRTENDYAVLKVGKGVRKVFMPAFETRTSIPIQALGDNK
jgi:hypothetical protein